MNPIRFTANALTTRPNAPWLLDLFSGAGGAAYGYWLARFNVLGVDIKAQKNYPFWFVQADALEFARDYGGLFDAIHASPPCQTHTQLKSLYKDDLEYFQHHKDYIEETRDILNALDKPYVIENVEGAAKKMKSPFILCGATFGLKVYRHRLFESNMLIFVPPHEIHNDDTPAVGRGLSSKGFISVTGTGGFGFPGGFEYAQNAMGIDWVARAELSQAIPPAYTRYIGEQLMRHIIARRTTAAVTAHLVT